MSPVQQPDAVARLRAVNPVAVDEDLGRTELARAALARILADPAAPDDPPRADRRARADRAAHRPRADRAARRRSWRSPRGLALVLAAVALGGGAALAASDPFGWWNANPGEARYGANPALHVRTPTAPVISCRARAVGGFRCVPSRSGQRYALIDAIQPPTTLTRAGVLTDISRELAAGKLSPAAAARQRADVAAVPDSFFREWQLASRFGTYGGGVQGPDGRTLVPPSGVPEFLVCEDAGAALSCQDLSGDRAAPVGAGVYEAEQAPNWRPAPPSRQSFALPPGIKFTAAEYRLVIDMIKASVAQSSSSAGTVPGSRHDR